MFDPIVRMGAAVLVAGVIAFAITFGPAANNQQTAGGATQQALPESFAKADRLRVRVKGPACSVHGWPDVERKCQFDRREPAGEARTVRIIALR